MQNPNSPQFAPSSSERLMATLAHLSIWVPHFGIIAPLVIWLSNRGHAPFAAYQAKQAFYFHLSIIALTWLIVIVAVLFVLLTLGIGLIAIVGLWPLLPALHLAPMIYGTVAAIQAHDGRDFRYVVIGNLVEPD